MNTPFSWIYFCSCFLLTLFSFWLFFTLPPPPILLSTVSYFLSRLSFSYLCFVCLGCRISGQRGYWTQTAPGAAGWDLCCKVRLPPSPALHAADGQQCHPWANCSARHQQSQCWLGSHCWPDSLHWVLQVGGDLATAWCVWRYFITSLCSWSEHATQNGTMSYPVQTQNRWVFIEKQFFLIAE